MRHPDLAEGATGLCAITFCPPSPANVAGEDSSPLAVGGSDIDPLMSRDRHGVRRIGFVVWGSGPCIPHCIPRFFHDDGGYRAQRVKNTSCTPIQCIIWIIGAYSGYFGRSPIPSGLPRGRAMEPVLGPRRDEIYPRLERSRDMGIAGLRL